MLVHNNPPPLIEEHYVDMVYDPEDPLSFIAFQREISKRGTPHLQIFIELDRPCRYSFISLLFPGCDHREMTSSRPACIKYCTRSDKNIDPLGLNPTLNGPWIAGEQAPGQGNRTDVAEVLEAIFGGTTYTQLARSPDFAHMVLRYPRGLRDVCDAQLEPTRSDSFQVTLSLGPPGVGKTYDVFDEFPDIYCPTDENWFNNYEGGAILLDDYSGQCSLRYLLRLLDDYKFRLPVKGGFVGRTADAIFITSNFSPASWFHWAGREIQYKALCRRVHNVLIYENRGECYALDEDLAQSYLAYCFFATFGRDPLGMSSDLFLAFKHANFGPATNFGTDSIINRLESGTQENLRN